MIGRATQAAASTKSLGASTAAVSSAVGKAGAGVAKLAGAASMLSPAAGEAARSLADLADVGEVGAEAAAAMGLSVAAAGVAAGVAAEAAAAGYVAWRVYAEENERVEQTMALVQAGLNALDPILDSTRDATIALKVATGELSEEQGKLATNSQRAFDTFMTSTEATRKAMAALRAEQVSTGTQMVDMAESIIPAWTPLGWVIDKATTSSAEMETEIGQLRGVLNTAAAATEANVKVTGDLIHKETEAKSSVEALAAARKKANEEFIESIDYQTAELRARIASQQAARQEQLDADKLAYEASGAVFMEQVAAKQRAQEEADAALAESARELAEAQIAEQQRVASLQIQGASDLAGGLASIAQTTGDAMADSNRESAMTAYKIAKAAAIVQAGINAAVGIGEAAASAPWPENLVPIAAQTVQGAANVAAVAVVQPPSFHTGTSMVGDDPRIGEINARLKSKEAVASEQGVDQLGGRGVIEAANAGRLRGRSGGSSNTTVRFGHKAIHTTMREAVRTDGPLSRSMNTGKVLGHRQRS